MTASKKHSRFFRSAFDAIEALETRQLLSTTVPNLTYTLQFKAPAIILPGTKQTAKLEITNTGGSLIETKLPITVYVSDAPTLDADSSQQTILSIDPSLRLNAKKSKSMAVQFTMPASFVTGTCYVLVSTNQQVFSTSAMYNPSAGYGTGTFGNAPATGNDASEYLDSGTWTANGQTNAFSVNIRNLSDGSVYGDVLASGNFGQLSVSNLVAQINKNGRFNIHGADITASIYPPGSSGSDSSDQSDSGTGTSGTTEEVNLALSGQINSSHITGSIHLASIKPTSTTGTTGSSTGNQADSQTSTSTYTRISGSGNFDLTPPAPSVSGTGTGTGTTPAAVVIGMSQLPSTVSSNFTLTGSYPNPSYVGTITATLTNSQGNSLAPFTSYTVNTGAGTWAVSIPITGVPDGVYTVTVTDTNTGGTTPVPESGGMLTISTIGTNLHFDSSQLPLVTNTNQTLTGTYDATDVDGKQMTGITVYLTDSSGNQNSFPATLSDGTWSALISITGLTNGAYTVTATATDSAGNTGAAAAPGNFTIDTLVNSLASDVKTTTPGPWMATPNTPFALSGTYTDPDAEDEPDGTTDVITAFSIHLTDSQGNATSFPAILNKGNWNALINTSSLSPGTYIVTGTVVDSNGSTVTAIAAGGTLTVLGLSPAEMRGAYGLGQVGSSPITFNGTQGDGSGETIAIIDAFDDPNAQSDLAAFDEQFGLPNAPSFEKLNQQGQTSPLPGTDPTGDYETEESLDIQWAHAMAPEANIILFEANSASSSDLFSAVQAAATTPGVDVVSMSFGAVESASDEAAYDNYFSTAGITFVASSGDDGATAPGVSYPSVSYPAASPNVVAVGGTVLSTNGNNYSSETAWSGSGGGISVYESQPAYQSGIVSQSSTQRTVPDLSMDAAPNTGVPIYDSFDSPANPWIEDPVGGTSLAAPMFAAIVAVADQGRAINGLGSLGSSQTLQQLYAAAGTSAFHDITTGSNGYYSAGAGYDMVTGLGSPVANLLIPELVSAASVNSQTHTVNIGQLPATIGSNFTLTGSYPNLSYVGSITVTLTNSQGNSLAPFTTYTVNTTAGTWSVPISIADVPDGIYSVTVTDTNTSGTTSIAGSGGHLTVSTIGSNVHFNSTQLPLVTNTNQTLTGTYDATDADGSKITGITVYFTDSSGNQTSFPATLNSANHTWSVPVSIANLANGAYTVTAVATDSGDNSGTAAAPGNFTVNTLVNTLGSDVQFTSNAEQLITINNSSDFTLTFLGQTTDPIVYDSNPDTLASNITAALGNLSTVGNGNVTVVSQTPNSFLVTFTGAMAGSPEPIMTSSGPGVQIVETGYQWPINISSNIILGGTYSVPDSQTGPDSNTDAITAIIINLTDSQGNTKSFAAILDNGIWSSAINVGSLADGTYTITATVFDSNGNTGTAVAPGTFTVD